VERAYSLLTIKSVDAERRLIRGTATSPVPDRAGDVLEPLGATFADEIPLLLHHNKQTPVGVARFEPPTKKGIDFEAELPIVTEPGAVKDEVDRAWVSVLHKLIRGVSIGFRVIDDAIEPLKSGGLRFLKTEILELSLVTVPAHQAATVAIVKAIDQAATGHVTPPASGQHTRKVAGPMNPKQIKETIKAYENTRAAKSARMTELMTVACDKGETLDAEGTIEYDDLAGQVKDIDAHLVRMNDRLKEIEKDAIDGATPVTGATDPAKAATVRAGLSVSNPRSLLPKGTAFTRYAMAIGRAKGDTMLALEFAKQWKDSTPEVELMIKAAVAPGTTTGATWAMPLVPPTTTASGEFLELLRPATIIGNLPQLRNVPFNTSVPAQTGGGTYNWVGQAKPKPLTALAFATVSLGFAKIAGIVVLTDELVRMSSPSAEQTVRNDMIAGVAAFMDQQFIDPAVAAVPTVNPASITNGATNSASSGATGDNAKTDIKKLISTFVAANLSLKSAAIVMSEANAFALATALNPLGQPAFPGFSQGGGSILGVPVVTSSAAGTNIVIIDQSGILYADDGATTIDVSREASLQMDSAPASPADATTVLVSLWQHNMVGLRVERYATWARARMSSVSYITGAAYV
jgi:HK97 family phage major capsid protein/HK97 family phage prohead protease